MKPIFLAACLNLCFVAPSLAAAPASSDASASPKPAEKCLADLRAFDEQKEQDGYWLSGSSYSFGYGYGYPMGGFSAKVSGYHNVRPGHEIRVLVASATILAGQGQQQQCEAVLSTARDLYSRYMAGLQRAEVPKVNVQDWRQQEIDAARPVTDNDAWFRSQQLIGTEVRDPGGQPLGSIADLVLAPQTGKLSYLVIDQEGLFGFGDRYIPVPWTDFKLTPTGMILVLDTTRSAVEAAPWGHRDQFTTPTQFDLQGQKVDAYWQAHLTR